jgi:hypothetical protein
MRTVRGIEKLEKPCSSGSAWRSLRPGFWSHRMSIRIKMSSTTLDFLHNFYEDTKG